VYIPGALEDNPYLPEGYERDLAVLTPWRFQQLRHNDWNIVAGLFFTEFAASTHVQDLGDPADSVAWFRSMDWGYVAPGVCHWWACLPDRRYYVRYEFKFSHATIPQVCSEIINRTKDAGISRVRYTAADPAMWQQLGTTGEAMNETFAKCRVPITKAHNDRVNGWQRCHEILALRSDGKPTTVIHPSCVYLIRTLASAISAKQNPEDIDIDDDHPLDSFRYGAMSRPAPTAVKHRTSNRTFKAAQQRIAEFRRHMSLR
jgi:hypothetical protein